MSTENNTEAQKNESQEKNSNLLETIQNSPNFFDLAISHYNEIENGALAFCSNYLDIDQVPRILDFLPDSKSKITFLDFCVYQRKYDEKSIHQKLFQAYVDSLPTPTKTVRICDEQEPLKSFREKFLNFIQYSNYLSSWSYEGVDNRYIDEKLFLLQKCKLYEECATLLLESGMTLEQIVDFCDNCENQAIFTLVAKKIKDKNLLCQLLNERGEVITISDVISTINDQIMVEELRPFFDKVTTQRIEETKKIKYETTISQIVLKDKIARLKKFERGSVEIDENTNCAVCLNPIGTSPFCLTQNNIIVHKECISKI
ncbi:Vam6/Vps39-like protein [Tritrichomonas musculus]|uniref:Vam6/Vps39-like protein n=1 Tax=Tritrichomonas musculus TaxID=1915356 RepID=A0ABR2K357_9EUKA